MKNRWQSLSHFAFSMATCLSSGLPPKKALALSAGATPSGALNRAVRLAIPRCERGIPISDALEPERRSFPAFFIPVLRAGELGGRHVEAYQLVQAHCDRLGPALTLVRNTWLYPLICILAGWAIQTCIMLYFLRFHMAVSFVRSTFLNSAVLVLAVWFLLRIRPVRLAVDWLLLQVPFVRNTQIGLAVVLYFSTFRLAYEAGGLSVLKVFDLALATVSNLAIRQDILRARPVLEENGSFEDAFNEPELLDDSIKGAIAAGGQSGHLGSSLDRIVQMQTTRLSASLELFNRIFQRLVAYTVVFSIVETVLMCVLYTPAR